MLRILDPEAETTIPRVPLAPRLRGLDGKTVWFLDGLADSLGGAAAMHKIYVHWKARLEREFRLKAVHYERSDYFATPFRHGKGTFDRIVRTGDVVINGVCFCGAGTSSITHDGVQYERSGLPTATLVTDRFEVPSRAQAKMMGLPELPILVFPHEVHFRASVEGARAEADRLYPGLLACLVEPGVARTPATSGSPAKEASGGRATPVSD
jgi:hypothetical protein